MYSLTYEFEDLPVHNTTLSGRACIEFGRDRDWTVDYITVTPEPHLRRYPVVDWIWDDTILAALVKHREQAITNEVNAYDIEPLRVEREIARYEWGRG